MSSIITQVPLFLKNLFIQFLLEPSDYSWNSKMVEVSEGEGNANLLSLLEKLHLGHLEKPTLSFESTQNNKSSRHQRVRGYKPIGSHLHTKELQSTLF